MRRVARYFYVGVAWVAIAGFLANIYLAGMAVFVNRSYWDLHREFGYAVGWIVLIYPPLGLLAWIPRRLTAWLAGLLLYYLFHTILPVLQENLGWIAAFHPVSAVLLVWLGLSHARRAGALLLEGRALAPEPISAETA
ncbi:MAG TPA: DUF6220 domain-containing protein [Anaerolineales bacterium]